MPSKNRSKTDIVAPILEAANGNWVIQTKIAYDGFLSHRQLREYIPKLIESNLLEYRADNQAYRTTEKGKRFLNIYHNIDQLVLQ